MDTDDPIDIETFEDCLEAPLAGLSCARGDSDKQLLQKAKVLGTNEIPDIVSTNSDRGIVSAQTARTLSCASNCFPVVRK